MRRTVKLCASGVALHGRQMVVSWQLTWLYVTPHWRGSVRMSAYATTGHRPSAGRAAASIARAKTQASSPGRGRRQQPIDGLRRRTGGSSPLRARLAAAHSDVALPPVAEASCAPPYAAHCVGSPPPPLPPRHCRCSAAAPPLCCAAHPPHHPGSCSCACRSSRCSDAGQEDEGAHGWGLSPSPRAVLLLLLEQRCPSPSGPRSAAEQC